MAITAHDIIRSAAKTVGIVDPYEQLDATEADDCLGWLNNMLDSWSLESLSIFQILQEKFTLTPGVGTYAIGPSAVGGFITTRPVEIYSAFVRQGGIDYPVEMVTRQEYDRIPIKSIQTSWPCYLFYQPSIPNGEISLYEVPSVSSLLFLNSEKQFTQFDALTTAVVLPPGYRRAIEKNLAMEICAEFKRPASQELVAIARESKANIQRKNDKIEEMRIDYADFSSNRVAGYGWSSRADFIGGY